MVEIADDLTDKCASLFKGQHCVSAVRRGLLAGWLASDEKATAVVKNRASAAVRYRVVGTTASKFKSLRFRESSQLLRPAP
jgi:hypothetical protein